MPHIQRRWSQGLFNVGSFRIPFAQHTIPNPQAAPNIVEKTDMDATNTKDAPELPQG